MTYLIYSIGLFYITLTLYLAIMNVAKYKDSLTLTQKIVFAPILIMGLLCDVLFRYTVGIILKFPQFKKDDLLFTSVLQAYVNQDSWKGKVSRFFCHLLDQFDPSGTHC